MADEFSFLTDSEDERAVEDVLSQVMDHSVLEQIAAINCSSFSNSDNLPSHLENRFRKLKSLPPNTSVTSAVGSRFSPAKSRSFRPRSGDDSKADEVNHMFCNSVDFGRIPDLKKRSENSSVSADENLFETKDLKKGSGKSSRPADSPKEHSDENLVETKGTQPKPISSSNTNFNSNVNKQKDSKSKSGTGSSKSRSDSWSLSSPESEPGTPSPPRRSIGCLWCSPKKEKSVLKKQGKENRLSSSSSSWGNDVEFLKTFSIKEQKKIMKQAMKEEEKINREAEKIVKWAKQASARMMDVAGVVDDDELDDFENTK